MVTAAAPDRRPPLDADSRTEEIRRIQQRLAQLERANPRPIRYSADGFLIVPGIRVPGRGNPTGSGGPVLIGDAPGDPQNVAVATSADEDSSWINVTWDPPSGGQAQLAIAGYEVRWSRGTVGNWVYLRTTGDSQRIDNVVAGLDYYVEVRSESTIGVFGNGGPNSDGWIPAAPYPLTVSADTTPPANPTGVTVAVGYRALGASWDDNTERDLAGYDWQVSDTSGFGTILAEGTVTANIISTAELPDTGQAYWFRVRARDFSGNTSAYVTGLAGITELIPNAHIIELSVNKLRAGTIGAEIITLSNSVNSRIQSFDGSTMVIRGDGYAQFSNVAILGGALTIGSRASITSNGTATFDFMTATNASVTGTLRTGTSGDYVLVSAGSSDLYFYDAGVRRGRIHFLSSRMSFMGPVNSTGLFLTSNRAAMTAPGGITYVGAQTDGISDTSPTVNIGPRPPVLSDATVNNSVSLVAGTRPIASSPGRVAVNANEGVYLGTKQGVFLYLWSGSLWRQSLYLAYSGGFTDFRFTEAGLPPLAGGITMTYVGTSNQIGYTSSSITTKRDVAPIEDPIGMVGKLRPVMFRWNSEVLERSKLPEDHPAEPGLIAEQVAEVLPHWASYDAEGEVTGKRDAPILAALVAATQNINERLTRLENP